MKKKLWKGLRVIVGSIAAIIGFIASVTGIYSWLGVTSLHLGNVVVPNPIIIVAAILIALLLMVVAFLGGAFYILAAIASMLSALFKMVPTSVAKAPQASPLVQAPLKASEKEQEQVQTISQAKIL